MTPLSVAIGAAQAAGHLLLRDFHREHIIRTKGAYDYVTEVDVASEALIVETIREVYPLDAFLGEEGHRPDPEASRVWIIDPLDGTRNYTVGIPFFCVSIALQVEARTALGVIYDPVRDETFSASAGQGSSLNGETICNTPKDSFDGAIAYMGWKPSQRLERPGLSLPLFLHLKSLVAAMRNMGSAALSLAYVSCGRIDLAFHDQLSPWDMLAGALLIEEAGGVATDSSGRPISFDSRDIIAANGAALHASLLCAAQEILGEPH